MEKGEMMIRTGVWQFADNGIRSRKKKFSKKKKITKGDRNPIFLLVPSSTTNLTGSFPPLSFSINSDRRPSRFLVQSVKLAAPV